VPFTLKVTEGPGAGAEFPFDTMEARLGRTADNDIVVKDAGASRSHARVFQKGIRYFVEDLKSANGTKVNDAVVDGTKELKNGDTIAIGEVVFVFSFADQTVLKAPDDEDVLGARTELKRPLEANDTGDSTGETTESTGETQGERTDENPVLDPNATILKPPPARVTLDPERERRTTTRRPSSADLDDAETGPPMRAPHKPPDDATVPPSRALVRKAEEDLQASDSGTLEVKVPPALARRAGAKAAADDEPLTAADKLRLKRQANKSALGRIKYAYGQLPKSGQRATAAGGGLLALALIALVVFLALPQKKKSAGPEPQELSAGAPTIEESFGLGEGVTFERPDMKIFSFTAASATRIVGVLHYQARDISKDEVSVTLNGADLGFVPPDTLDTANRELELVLPAQQIQKSAGNQLVFDNVRNPPGDDPWRIWHLWLELIAIPDLSPEETVAAVKEDLERSQGFFEKRDIGPENLFKAWKGYREAWLKMESMTVGRPDELYIVARSQQREVLQLLDKRCNLMLLDYQKAMSSKRPDKKRAREVVEDMLRYFPTREHRCNGLARSLLEDLGGL
jgi:pSer/pThr/pTyr-binding forkhead associated (FHA) protein